MKDDNGMLLTPVISFKRNNLSINTDLAKLKVEQKRFSHQNVRTKSTQEQIDVDQFSVLTGQFPKKSICR